MKAVRPEAARSLRDAWANRNQNLVETVRALHDFQSRYDPHLSYSADLLGARPALVYVYLTLFDLSDDILQLIHDKSVSPSAWLYLTKLSQAEQNEAIEEIGKLPNDGRPLGVLKRFMEEERVRKKKAVHDTSGKVLMHLAKKAKDYGRLSPKSRHALVSFGMRLTKDAELTDKQRGYLDSILRELKEYGVLDKACDRGAKSDMCREARNLYAETIQT